MNTCLDFFLLFENSKAKIRKYTIFFTLGMGPYVAPTDPKHPGYYSDGKHACADLVGVGVSGS